MELHDIQLTEQDFNLLIEGLDELPNKGNTGSFMGDILGTLMFKPGSYEANKFAAEKEAIDKKRKEKVDAMKEELTLLKSKLILLKRYLVTNGALKTTNKILGNE